MKILFIFGTRPEAIKFAPLIRAMQNDKFFEFRICITGQHLEMLDQVLTFFEIVPDYKLSLMRPNQSLNGLSSRAIEGISPIIQEFSPQLVFVQGDTTSAMIGALCAYYSKTKVAHLEAGLRSWNKYSPFPEEINRKLIGSIADLHFAPTQSSKENLALENVLENVWIVGNTVIDALFLGLELLKNKDEELFNKFNFIDWEKKLILVTAHRRENFGQPLQNICNSILEISENHKDVQFLFPVHLNPNVQSVVHSILGGKKNIFLSDPLDYSSLIWLMNRSYFILTDSGGIQEEAPSLGKPVVVLREITERNEGIEAGTATLVGTDPAKICETIGDLLRNNGIYQGMARSINPYGKGDSSDKIIKILKNI